MKYHPKLVKQVMFYRMFDSQNNNRGGYNAGNLYYYTGSTVQIEWWVKDLSLMNPLCNFIQVYHAPS